MVYYIGVNNYPLVHLVNCSDLNEAEQRIGWSEKHATSSKVHTGFDLLKPVCTSRGMLVRRLTARIEGVGYYFGSLASCGVGSWPEVGECGIAAWLALS